MPLIIRRASTTDIPQLASLFDGYRVYYKQESNIEVARAFLQQRLRNDDSTLFVAELNTGELAGFVQLYPIFSSVSARSSLLLNDLFVCADARGQGVGKALMQQASVYGKEMGACWIMLQTEITNSGAQALYESIGYTRDRDCYYYYLPEPY